MKIAMIGTGYVGLVSGVCFSEFGFEVICVDQDEQKIADLNRGILPIYEPGLDSLLEKNKLRLTFTTDLEGAVKSADIVFIAVGTPSRRGDGEADLQFVFEAAKQIARSISENTVIVIKSTVVVGTNKRVREIISDERPKFPFSVASNPEFLREGSAIEDFMRPDRVVIGVTDKRAEQSLKALYAPLNLRDTPMAVTTPENAELIKYAGNAFLAMKVTFINEIADLCEKVGANVQDIANGIGLDKRIGNKFLHAGPGFGGSCFPKDTRALAATGHKFGAPIRLIDTVVSVNEERKSEMSQRIVDSLGDPAGKTVAILGLAFKPNTDDMRESPSLNIIGDLINHGCQLKVHDPEAMKNCKEIFPNIEYCSTPFDAVDGADAAAIVTEWNVYRAMDLGEIARRMRGNVLVDFRNIYSMEAMSEAELTYISIGRSATVSNSR